MAAKPRESSYQTTVVNLLKTEFSRGTTPTTDTDYMNVIVEVMNNKDIGDQDFALVKRPGSSLYVSGATGSELRGIYFNADFQKLYWAYGQDLYVWNVTTNTLSTSISGFFTTSTGDVGFTDYLYDTGVQTVVLTDGTTLKMIASDNTVTTCADADLPTPHKPYPIFLDGYLFLLKSATGDLYNSNLNDPMLWTAGDFISCEILPDQAVRPAKLNNYIVVFGTNSIEYFWDAGNTSGSPLQRNDTPVKFNGYLGGFAQNGSQIMFVGNNIDAQPEVFLLEDLKMTPISDESLCRYLAGQTTSYSAYKGSVVAVKGHTLYVLNAGTYTYVYDMKSKQWTRWGWQSNVKFDMVGAVNIKTGNSYRAVFARANNGNIYQFDSTLGQDVAVNYPTYGVTANEMFGSYSQKTMSRLTVICDKALSSSSAMQISWSDDDYQTFNTPQSVLFYQERPSINRLGRFRRRAFKWSYTGSEQFRIKGLEVQINTGIN